MGDLLIRKTRTAKQPDTQSMGLNAWADKVDFGPGKAKRSEKRKQLAVEWSANNAKFKAETKDTKEALAGAKADFAAETTGSMAQLAAINKETKEAFAANNKETKEAFAANNKETKEAFAGIKADWAAAKADQAAKNKETQEARAAKADFAAETTGSMAQPAAPKTGRVKAGAGQIVCPHCQVRGRVQTKRVKVKRGISGGKATGAVLTGGFSILATGLSRKETATQATCKNCHVTWMF